MSDVAVQPLTLAPSDAVIAPVENIIYYDLSVIGDRLYVTTWDSTVAVIDANTGELVGTPVDIPDFPRSGFAVTADGNLALVTTDDDEGGPQGLQVVNLQTGVTKFVATGDGPQWVTVNAAGTRAYVSNAFDNTISVIDIASATPTKLYDLTGVTGPEAAVVVGNKIYVTSYDDESVYVFDANNSGAAQQVCSVGSHAWGIDAAPDGRVVVTTDDNITVINPADGSVQTIDLPDGWLAGYGVTVSPDGSLAYATAGQFDGDDQIASGLLVIDLATNTLVGDPIVLDDYVWGVRISPDGKTVYVPLEAGGIYTLTLTDSTTV